MKNELTDYIKSEVTRYLDFELTPDDYKTSFTDLGLNSMDLMELSFNIEKKFNLELEINEITGIINLEEFIGIVHKNA